jgi:hypothetical protein
MERDHLSYLRCLLFNQLLKGAPKGIGLALHHTKGIESNHGGSSEFAVVG